MMLILVFANHQRQHLQFITFSGVALSPHNSSMRAIAVT